MQLQLKHTQRKLLESLHQSPGQWAAFLQLITEQSNARSARMLVLDKQASMVQSSIKYNIDDACHQQYVEHYVNHCPWRPELAALPAGRLYSTYLDFSCKQNDYYKTEFYNDWAGPQDIHHGVCGTIYQSDEQKVQLLIQRCKGQGHFNRDEMAVFNALVPHLRGVITMQQQFAAHEAKTNAINRMQLMSPMPLILLNHDGGVNYISQQAEQALATGGELTIVNNRLVVSADPVTRLRFSQRLTDCIASARGQWHRAAGWFAIKRSQGGEYGLLIMPVHPEAKAFDLSGGQSFAAVFIYDPAIQISLCSETLKVMYGITPAEAELLKALVHGESLESYAQSRSRSLHTVKTQLRSLFRKTGTVRQLSLIQQIISGPARITAPQPIVDL